MLYGRVIGTAVSTVKHASMNGQKLLVVQPCMADGKSPDGDPQVAIDGVGAGIGELVMITSDGANARESLQADRTPVRWTVVGIDDGLAR
ncbi:MAG: EutN/CcmL family microcompartment protein [Pirellulaceae bacterium]|nr:EutN/CcmL family microcompartment protein [Pirellulaceae bacterium]